MRILPLIYGEVLVLIPAIVAGAKVMGGVITYLPGLREVKRNNRSAIRAEIRARLYSPPQSPRKNRISRFLQCVLRGWSDSGQRYPPPSYHLRHKGLEVHSFRRWQPADQRCNRRQLQKL